MSAESATEEQPMKSNGIMCALSRTVQKAMGKSRERVMWQQKGHFRFYYWSSNVMTVNRSEGSLNQHLKIKHPEYYQA